MRAAAPRCRCARSPASRFCSWAPGEKSEALELFQPERIASRILGMGDVLSLVEQVQGQVDQEKAEKLAKKISKGKSFDLSDLARSAEPAAEHGRHVGAAGQTAGPNAGQRRGGGRGGERQNLKRQMGIIDSMTPRERRRPDMIDNRASAALQQEPGCSCRRSTAC
jgi:signal recognition particle subunit SRP54